jgi:hypothetical protein
MARELVTITEFWHGEPEAAQMKYPVDYPRDKFEQMKFEHERDAWMMKLFCKSPMPTKQKHAVYAWWGVATSDIVE